MRIGQTNARFRTSSLFDPCLSCGDAVSHRGYRGLCLRCYEKEDVRVLFRPGSSGHRGIGRSGSGARLADSPCPHRPGSVEKIEEMARRAEEGVCLFHPDDARLPEDPEIDVHLRFLKNGCLEGEESVRMVLGSGRISL